MIPDLDMTIRACVATAAISFVLALMVGGLLASNIHYRSQQHFILTECRGEQQ